MKKIYKVSYANKIEVLEVCYENKECYFYDPNERDIIYGIRKKEVDEFIKKSKDYGYFTSEKKANKFRDKYIESEIHDLENRR